MPGQSCEDVAFRSTNPVKRAADIFLVVLLQLLMLMIAAADQDPDTLRNHPVSRSNSILSRFDAGETFDLPPLLIASIRATIRVIRGDLRNRSADAAQPGSPRHVVHLNPAARFKAARRRVSARHAAQAEQRIQSHGRPSASQPVRATIPGLFQRIAESAQGLPTPISLRYRNDLLTAGSDTHPNIDDADEKVSQMIRKSEPSAS